MIWLDTLDLTKVRQDIGTAQACRTIDERPLRLAGKTYERGIGTHSRSEMTIDLKRAATRFEAIVGTDDEVEGRGTVVFEVWVDGKKAARTDVLSGEEAVSLSVDLTGASKLVLAVKDGGDGTNWDHADWADARITLDPTASERPEMAETSPFMPYVSAESPEPCLTTPRGVGAVVGRKFDFRVPATGAEPMTFSAHGLPPGMAIDAKTGVISGVAEAVGDFTVELAASNSADTSRRTMTISVLDLGARKPAEPVISGPRSVGTTPGRAFLFLVPATGEGPLAYSAENLPEGLMLDPNTGIITGSVGSEGEFAVDLTVIGPLGTARRTLTIIAGDHKLAQTPPMGYNSWNAWGMSVSDEKIRQSTDAMVEKGLAACGFQHINIDDGWEGERDSNGEILSNAKFPDMAALADYVHSKGLKIGIYSSPGPKTCGGLEGSWQHEEQDALTWSKWGFDYIKYDLCSYLAEFKPQAREEHEHPYRVMRAALDKCDRDIVYSICWSHPEVHLWGPIVGGNLWRTTGDIVDTWESLDSIGFRHDGYDAFAGPGHWNDPDMLIVGRVGWGPNVHPTRLTAHEQVTHITLWCLLAAPLLIGCDMAQLDEFTVALLTNPEVIDIDQDPLGKAASRKSVDGSREVWARPLFDGSIAVGLFNRGEDETEVTVNWSDLGIEGARPVRDLWQRKDLGEFTGSFTAKVARHGAVMVRVGNRE